MSKISLVILAAGLGSRYRGTKQIDAINAQGQTIMEHSIYDALKAGFEKFVFVIRKELQNQIEENFGTRLRNLAKVEYVNQSINDLPKGISIVRREKPWGTGHALFSTRFAVDEKFAVVNADDFYGANSIAKIGSFLKQEPSNTHNFAMIGFPIENTLSESGTVSRGVCKIDSRGNLQNVKEATMIKREGSRIVGRNEGHREFEIPKGTLVSMNLWGFSQSIFSELDSEFRKFLEDKSNESKEFFLPAAVDKMVKRGFCNVRVIETNDLWHGITYREDHQLISNEIGNLDYPKRLF